MHRSRSFLRSLIASAALVASVGLSSCATLDDDAWTFGLTRSLYRDLSQVDWESSPAGVETDGHYSSARGRRPLQSGDPAGPFLAFLVLPIAVDVVVLPVAYTRDLIVSD